VGAAAALLATVIGTTAAVVMPKPETARLPLQLAIALPLVLPPVVLAVAWFGLFSDLHLIGTMRGIAIAHGFLGVPFVYLNVAGALASLNRELILAAKSLGASPIVVFGRIVLPIVAPGVLAGALLTFILSFDELILPFFLGGGAVQTIPVVMWSQVQYVTSPEIAAVAAITTTVTLVTLSVAVLIGMLRMRRISK
jgi:putative spermidine/putrescine transport system permease protein